MCNNVTYMTTVHRYMQFFETLKDCLSDQRTAVSMHNHPKLAMHHAVLTSNLHESMENPNTAFAIPYLVSTNQMDHDKDIGNVNEPVWVVETKACQQISWSVVTKGSIPNKSNPHVETGCDKDCCGGGFLHLRRL